MKNADMPAMPLVVPADVVCSPQSGLTKREMMAMHAPEIPDWFCDWWREEYVNNDFYFGSSAAPIQAGTEPSRTITKHGLKALYFAWRTNYADALLEVLERTCQKP